MIGKVILVLVFDVQFFRLKVFIHIQTLMVSPQVSILPVYPVYCREGVGVLVLCPVLSYYTKEIAQ